MTYSPQEFDSLVDSNIKELNKKISICRKVKDLVESPGWKDVIGPIIDREIMDVVGGKVGDMWISGKVNRARSEEKREYWIGYKQALINLHNRIMFHIDEMVRSEEAIKTIESDKRQGARIPLMEDTRYASS